MFRYITRAEEVNLNKSKVKGQMQSMCLSYYVDQAQHNLHMQLLGWIDNMSSFDCKIGS